MKQRSHLDAKVKEVLNSNHRYYQMLDQWHNLAGGLAVEPEVERFIEEASQTGTRILEAGSGSGNISNWFAFRHQDTQFVGIDISAIGVKIARKKALANAHFEVADLKRLPFKDKAFHFIFAQSVLEHVVGWEHAIAEFYRVLLPNGGLLVRLENAGIHNVSSRYHALLNYVVMRNRLESDIPSFQLRNDSWHDHENNFDVNHIPSDVLVKRLKQNGFLLSYFTTGTRKWRYSKDLKARFVSYLQFWPFNHLGATTIVVARRPS